MPENTLAMHLLNHMTCIFFFTGDGHFPRLKLVEVKGGSMFFFVFVIIIYETWLKWNRPLYFNKIDYYVVWRYIKKIVVRLHPQSHSIYYGGRTSYFIILFLGLFHLFNFFTKTCQVLMCTLYNDYVSWSNTMISLIMILFFLHFYEDRGA